MAANWWSILSSAVGPHQAVPPALPSTDVAFVELVAEVAAASRWTRCTSVTSRTSSMFASILSTTILWRLRRWRTCRRGAWRRSYGGSSGFTGWGSVKSGLRLDAAPVVVASVRSPLGSGIGGRSFGSLPGIGKGNAAALAAFTHPFLWRLLPTKTTPGPTRHPPG